MDRINLIAGALVEICCCCLKQNFSDVAEDGEGIALFFPPSEKPYFDTSNDTLWGPIWRFISSQNNNQSEVSPQHNTEKQPFKNLGHNWKLFQNPPTPQRVGVEGLSLACYFYCGSAKWNHWLQQAQVELV